MSVITAHAAVTHTERHFVVADIAAFTQPPPELVYEILLADFSAEEYKARGFIGVDVVNWLINIFKVKIGRIGPKISSYIGS